jgi:hypothetical protein
MQIFTAGGTECVSVYLFFKRIATIDTYRHNVSLQRIGGPCKLFPLEGWDENHMPELQFYIRDFAFVM